MRNMDKLPAKIIQNIKLAIPVFPKRTDAIAGIRDKLVYPLIAGVFVQSPQLAAAKIAIQVYAGQLWEISAAIDISACDSAANRVTGAMVVGGDRCYISGWKTTA